MTELKQGDRVGHRAMDQHGTFQRYKAPGEGAVGGDCIVLWDRWGRELATLSSWLFKLEERPEHAATRQRTNDEEEYVINREADAERCTTVAQSIESLSELASRVGGENADAFYIAVERVFRDSQALLLKKHLDYGPKNISDSPGGPLNGLLVRMHDKMARLKHLTESGADPQNESVRDTVQDLGNYAVIYQLVLDGDWPE